MRDYSKARQTEIIGQLLVTAVACLLIFIKF
jgi:hypothetical protein